MTAITSQLEPPARKAGGKRRILVADDNRDAADTLAVLFRKLGHDVCTVYEGPEVLPAADEYHPNLLVLDIGMPTMSGYDIARQLRARPEFQNALLVAVTGWGQEEDRRRTREAGFDYHLVKPVDLRLLEELLNS